MQSMQAKIDEMYDQINMRRRRFDESVKLVENNTVLLGNAGIASAAEQLSYRPQSMPNTMFGALLKCDQSPLPDLQTQTTPASMHKATLTPTVKNRTSAVATSKSPSSRKLVQYVVDSRSDGIGSFIGKLMDNYFTREEQINNRVNKVDKVYNGKQIKHGQLNPVIIKKIKDQTAIFYPQVATMGQPKLNEIINNRCRKLKNPR